MSSLKFIHIQAVLRKGMDNVYRQELIASRRKCKYANIVHINPIKNGASEPCLSFSKLSKFSRSHCRRNEARKWNKRANKKRVKNSLIVLRLRRHNDHAMPNEEASEFKSSARLRTKWHKTAKHKIKKSSVKHEN